MNAQTDLPIGSVRPQTGPLSKLVGSSTLASVGMRWGSQPPDQIISKIQDDLATLLNQIRAINSLLNTTLTIPLMLASGGNHQAGAVPDPGATAGTAKFLREDATWTAITNLSGLPTSSVGLNPGDLWVDTGAGNVLKVV